MPIHGSQTSLIKNENQIDKAQVHSPATHKEKGHTLAIKMQTIQTFS